MAVVLLALPIALVGLVLALRRRVVVTVGVNEHRGSSRSPRRPGAGAWSACCSERWRPSCSSSSATGSTPSAGPPPWRRRRSARACSSAPSRALTARPTVGIRRSAAVETRTLGAILPRGRAVLLAVSTTLLVGVLALGAAWGSSDDLGRAGRWLTRQCVIEEPGVGQVLVGSSRGPWPGSFYAVPLALALVVLAVLVGAALRAIVDRPRPELDSRGLDTMLRRWSVGNVLTAATVTVLGTLGPVAVLMASALGGGTCPSTAIQHGGRGRRRGRRGARHRGGVGLLAGLGHSEHPRRRPAAAVAAADRPRSGAGAMTLSTVTVDVLDPTPPYEQLRRQLADLIGSGVLSPGDRLPPVRQLAADLGLAVGTVARTYRELEVAGYVRSRRGGGTKVATTAPAPPTPDRALEEAATVYLERAGRSASRSRTPWRRSAGPRRLTGCTRSSPAPPASRSRP